MTGVRARVGGLSPRAPDLLRAELEKEICDKEVVSVIRSVLARRVGPPGKGRVGFLRLDGSTLWLEPQGHLGRARSSPKPLRAFPLLPLGRSLQLEGDLLSRHPKTVPCHELTQE
jgi:hypothetical protein